MAINDDESQLDPNELPEKNGESSEGEDQGLFAHIDSTPLDDQVEGTGLVVKKGSGPLNRGNKRLKKAGTKPIGDEKINSEEVFPSFDEFEIDSLRTPQEPGEGDAGIPATNEGQIPFNAEDSPTPETGPSDKSIGRLIHKVSTTLGISHTVKEDSPSEGETQAILPGAEENKKTTSPFIQPASKPEPMTGEGDAGSSLGRLEELSSAEDDLKNKKPTTGPLGKRQTGPIYRKRQTGSLVLPEQDLDPTKPAEENSWIKTVTGTLLGREEPTAPTPLDSESLTSRLETIGQDLEPGKPTASEETHEPGWKAPFVQDQSLGLQGNESPQQPSPEGDAEFQAFLKKLNQLEPPKENPVEPKTGIQQKPGESVFKFDSTRPLKEEPSNEPSSSNQSPFITGVGSGFGLTGDLSTKEPPAESPEDLFSGGIEPSSWELPPEVQDLIDLQKNASAKAPGGDALKSDQGKEKTSSGESKQDSFYDLGSSSGVTDEQPFSFGLEEPLTSENTQPDKGSEDTIPPSGYEFGPFDFLTSYDESTKAASPAENDKIGPFDFLSQDEETAKTDQTEGAYDFGSFDFFSHPEEITPTPNLDQTKPLLGGIEPPEPDYFFKESPAGSELAEESTTPLSQLSGTEQTHNDLVTSDLRSLFETEDSFSAEAKPAADTAVSPPLVEPEAVPSPNVLTGFKLNNRAKLLIAIGALAATLTIVVILGLIIIIRSNVIPMPFGGQPKPQASAVQVQVPPTGLELTGGWTFYLKKVDLNNGVWTPQGGAEWLNGSELRRIVALPWNPQLEAVVQTLKSGDPVRLLMANNDIITYRIDKVEKVSQEQVDVLGGNTPGLVMILYRMDSNERWVVVCRP